MLQQADGSVVSVAAPDQFEYANEVAFITTDQALEKHLKIHHQPADQVQGIALATDGLRYKILDNPGTGSPYAQFYTDTWAYARQPDATSSAIVRFLSDVDDQTGDDKTLVVAVNGIDRQTSVPGHLSPEPGLPVDLGPDATQGSAVGGDTRV